MKIRDILRKSWSFIISIPVTILYIIAGIVLILAGLLELTTAKGGTALKMVKDSIKSARY